MDRSGDLVPSSDHQILSSNGSPVFIYVLRIRKWQLVGCLWICLPSEADVSLRRTRPPAPQPPPDSPDDDGDGQQQGQHDVQHLLMIKDVWQSLDLPHI